MQAIKKQVLLLMNWPATATPLAEFDAAIIDLDGTLVDTLGDFVAALELLSIDFVEKGYVAEPFTPNAVKPMVGKGSENLVYTALSVLNCLPGQVLIAGDAVDSEKNFAWACRRYQQHYRAVSGQHAEVYPGVLEGLQALRDAGLVLACVTNKPVAFAQPLLGQLGLDGYFRLLFGGDSFPLKKPDPMPLLKTCEALGTLPARTLMIGDSRNDYDAARAAGCPVVLVTYGYNHGQPIRAVTPDRFVDSLAELSA